MDALTLLDHAEAAGLRIIREGDLLHITGPTEAADIVRQISERKPAILSSWWTWQASRLLRQIKDADTRQTLAGTFDETAAHREYEQNQDRQTAEAIAFGALVAECVWRQLPIAVTYSPHAKKEKTP